MPLNLKTNQADLAVWMRHHGPRWWPHRADASIVHHAINARAPESHRARGYKMEVGNTLTLLRGERRRGGPLDKYLRYLMNSTYSSPRRRAMAYKWLLRILDEQLKWEPKLTERARLIDLRLAVKIERGDMRIREAVAVVDSVLKE